MTEIPRIRSDPMLPRKQFPVVGTLLRFLVRPFLSHLLECHKSIPPGDLRRSMWPTLVEEPTGHCKDLVSVSPMEDFVHAAL